MTPPGSYLFTNHIEHCYNKTNSVAPSINQIGLRQRKNALQSEQKGSRWQLRIGTLLPFIEQFCSINIERFWSALSQALHRASPVFAIAVLTSIFWNNEPESQLATLWRIQGRIQKYFWWVFRLIKLPYFLYVFGKTGLRKQCRPRSDAADATQSAILYTIIGCKMDFSEEKYK